MKVGIDGLGCDHGKSGAGSYLLSFTSCIPQSSDFQVEIFGLEEDRYTYTSGKEIGYSSVGIADTSFSSFRWHSHFFRSFVKKHNYDAVIIPSINKTVPSRYPSKSVAVVNKPVIFEKGNHHSRKLVKSLKKAPYVVASSDFVRNTLVSCGIDDRKISVIYDGIDHKLFFPELEKHNDFVDIKPFAIKRPYFIYGSRISGPEKKHMELIKAFSLFKEKTNLPHRLVIVGDGGEFFEELHKTVYDSPYANDIFFTGYFPHESFAKLYANAEACVFPAVNEGSGLPVIEAMACGIPVICSDSGALPEVGGNAALYFNSSNIDQIASLMELVVTDENLRKRMIDDGILQAAGFSWEKTVKETLDLIK